MPMMRIIPPKRLAYSMVRRKRKDIRAVLLRHIPLHGQYAAGGSLHLLRAFDGDTGYRHRAHYFRHRNHIPRHDRKSSRESIPGGDGVRTALIIHTLWQSTKWYGPSGWPGGCWYPGSDRQN